MTEISEAASTLAKGTAIVGLGSIAGRGLNLLAQVLMARSLQPRLFGEIMLTYTVVSTIGFILLLGLNEGVTRLVSASQDSRRIEFISAGYTISLMFGAVSMIAIIVLRDSIADLIGEPEIAALIPFFAMYLVVNPLSKISIAGLRGLKLSKQKVVARDLGAEVVAILVYVGFVVVGEAYFGAVIYWLSIPVATSVVAIHFLRQQERLTSVLRMPSYSAVAEIVSFSWPLALGTGFVVLMSKIDILMIGTFLGSTEVGLYRAVLPLSQISIIILTSFVFLYLPTATEIFQRDDQARLKRIFTKTTKWVLIFSLPIHIVLIFFSDDVVSVLYSTDYTSASSALVVLTIGAFVRVFAGPSGATIKAINRPRVDMVASAVAASVNVVLNIYLIPRYGIVGAAVATAVGFSLFNLLEIVAIYRIAGIHPLSLDLIKPAGLTICCAVLIRSQFHVIGNDELRLVSAAIVVTITYVLSIFVTNSLDESDMDIISVILTEVQK